ncbi:MAG: MtrB/PioB family outer membrane beta-barrel protein [Syntrophorhabdaceae bacterium]|nr:MtrB/PioB family outer membrane beta-barrel protein [Syntrophorhabdaceae bacterium]
MRGIRPVLSVLFTVVLSFIPLSVVMAQENGGTLTSSIDVEMRSYNVNGSDAKAHEYTDKRNTGLFGGIGLSYESQKYNVNFYSRDMGYDTQEYTLNGGHYGKFKYSFGYNEIIHNITTDAKSVYGNVRSDNLKATLPNTNPDTWPSTFDYYTKRKIIDMGFKLDLLKPFFFNVYYGHEKKDGIKPTGASSFGSAVGPSLELPEPIDYRTNNMSLEGGYAKKPFFVSFGYIYSDFKNSSNDLNFTLPGGTMDIFSLAPDSKLQKFFFKGSAFLPMNSRFTVNLSESDTTSDAANFTRFDGKITTKNYNLQLTTNPLRFLDGKIYYKYYERDNRSTGQILIGAIWTNATPLYYKNETLGAEMGIKLPYSFYIDGGYRYIRTEREIKDNTIPLASVLPYNWDNIYFANLKWNGIDYISARAGIEFLRRGADYRTAQSEAAYNRQFAYAAQNRDTFKAGVDIYPVENLNIGLEYNYKWTNYNDTPLGYTDDTREAFSINADYSFKKYGKLYGYFDIEKLVMNQRAITGTSYWDSKQKEKTYGYGLRADIYAIPKKLTFIIQHDYLDSKGTNDLGLYGANIWTTIGVPPNLPVNIPNVDKYKKYTVGVSALYNASDALSLKAGYTYARFDYSDAQYDNYQYAPTTGGSSYLTGAYSRPSYSANIVFLGLMYRFK